jgi:acetyl esterase/lipase
VPENEAGIIQQTHIYRSVGGLQLPVDIIHTPAAQRAPVILWLHGGALMRGSRTGLWRAARNRYLQAGFAVAAADYRLGPETKLPEIILDVQAAHAWLRSGGAGPAVDAQRIVVMGHSAGGYLTLLSGHWLSPKPAALVSFYGYGDIVGDWYSRPDPFYCQQPMVSDEEAARAVGLEPVSESGPLNNDRRGRYYLYTRQRGLWPKALTGHDPGQEPEFFDPYCPVRHVTADYPPVMLLHGDADTDVPVAQSIEMAAACQRTGTRHILKVLPGRGHGFDNAGLDDPLISAAFDDVLKFMRRETGLA